MLRSEGVRAYLVSAVIEVTETASAYLRHDTAAYGDRMELQRGQNYKNLIRSRFLFLLVRFGSWRRQLIAHRDDLVGVVFHDLDSGQFIRILGFVS